MHRAAASLRHWELTQELFDIGDEVAGYVENLAEATRDFDGELAAECLTEFDEIVDEARSDARAVVGELAGLRQALTTGVGAGELDAAPDGPRPAAPARLDAEGLLERHPVADSPIVVAELSRALEERTASTVSYLGEVVDYVLAATERGARDLGSLSLPHLYRDVKERVHAAAEGWRVTVIAEHPAFASSMRGNHPPAFLEERARVEAVAARVNARRKAQRNSGAAS